jgi:PIN domain nuclease of toxin-antitoxin system
MLVSKDRLDSGTDSATFCRLALDARAVRVLPITPEIAMESTRLDLRHGDPADHLIAATADVHNAILVGSYRRTAEIVVCWVA